MVEDPEESMKILYPSGVETKVSSSKSKGWVGKLIILHDFVKKLQTINEDELGREKQSNPLEMESRETDPAAQGSNSERERAKLRHAPRVES